MSALAISTSALRADTPRLAVRAQLAPVVEFESARWLAPLLLDLRSLETSGENVQGIGDFTVSPSTADHVRRLLAFVYESPLPEPRLAPFSGGGIALSSTLGNRELTFTAYPGQEDFVFSLTNESDESLDRFGTLSLEQPNALGEVIKAFLF